MEMPQWVSDIGGNFPLHQAVLRGLYFPALCRRVLLTVCSNARRDHSCSGGILGHICLNQDCQNLCDFARRNVQEIFLEGESE